MSGAGAIPARAWAGGVLLSLLAHAGMGGAAWLAVRPAGAPQQAMPEQRVSVLAQEVRRSSAEAMPPAAEAAPQASAAGATASQAAPPQSHAGAAPLPASIAAAAPLPSQTAAALPPPPALAATPAVAMPQTAIAVPAAPAAAALPAEALPLASTPPAAAAALASVPQGALLASAPAAAPAAAAAAPQAAALADLPAAGPRLAAAAPDAPASPASALPAERQTAALAPMGSVDPVLAETLAAFMQPGDINASAAAIGAVRDGIGAALSGFPCARLQSGFNPATGALELRGHIPDPAMQPLVLAALEQQLGPGLPVSGDLLILPRPQCQVLSGIEAVGLPQSSDQFTNPRVIGPDAHVRAYRFAEGQDLVLDLTAPDYDAIVYVDYFDAEGQVIHLQPNELVPARQVAAKTALRVGQDAEGQPALRMTVTPPFGQEIAVAFAASAPLYDDLRPLVEPAAPYLEFLAERVAAARAADPGFMGEWVYFFIATGPD